MKTEMERRFPVGEPTAEERAKLLQLEINATVAQPKSVPQIRDAAIARLSPSAMGEVKKALELYYADVEARISAKAPKRPHRAGTMWHPLSLPHGARLPPWLESHIPFPRNP